MAEPVIVPVLTWQQRLLHNAEVAIKSGSTWVVLVGVPVLWELASTIWGDLGSDSAQRILSMFPALQGWTPVLTVLVAFIGAKLRPSTAVSTQTKAMLDKIARLETNVWLRAHGMAEVPEPAGELQVSTGTPLPAPATMVVAAAVARQAPTFDTATPVLADKPAAAPARPAPLDIDLTEETAVRAIFPTADADMMRVALRVLRSNRA